MPPRMLGLDHFVLTVRNIEATAAWYVAVLGMRRHDSTDADGRTRTALCWSGGIGHWQKINLHEAGRERTPHAQAATPGSADFCFVVDTGNEPITKHLAEYGVPVELGPIGREGAMGSLSSVYIRDPDGNLIELSHPYLNSYRHTGDWGNSTAANPKITAATTHV